MDSIELGVVSLGNRTRAYSGALVILESMREVEKGMEHDILTGQEDNFMVDVRDGKKYRIVQLGPRIVMAENLAYKCPSGSYWTYMDRESNAAKYGYLYSWESAKIVAPVGWHLPTTAEWSNLFSDAIPSSLPGNEARALRRTLIARFNPLFGGWRFSDGTYHGMGEGVHFWECVADGSIYDGTHYFDADQNSNYSLGRSLAGLVRTWGCSIRLFKD
jgi:uncharacterized protein (TIGR02145 family)